MARLYENHHKIVQQIHTFEELLQQDVERKRLELYVSYIEKDIKKLREKWYLLSKIDDQFDMEILIQSKKRVIDEYNLQIDTLPLLTPLKYLI
jgi:hypothetical protein